MGAVALRPGVLVLVLVLRMMGLSPIGAAGITITAHSQVRARTEGRGGGTIMRIAL